jgi:hypothetical protein
MRFYPAAQLSLKICTAAWRRFDGAQIYYARLYIA